MKISEYSFADEKNKIIDIEELKRNYPEVAEFMMFEGIMDAFFEALDKVRNKASENVDYSKEVASFNDLLRGIEDYVYVTKVGKTSIFPVLGSMKDTINRENLGEVLSGMSYLDYRDKMYEIKKSIKAVRNVKEEELSDEDVDVYRSIRIAMIAPCSTPDYYFPDTELKVGISGDGININDSFINVDYNAAQSQRREILKEFDVDNILKELGMTNPIQRMLAKRKIDPAVLIAIKESDFKCDSLNLFKKSIELNYSDDINVDEIRTNTVKQYVAAVTGNELEVDGKNAFYVEYDVRNVSNPTMKRYARRTESIKNMLAIGDTRSVFEMLKDKIFGKKIEESEIVEEFDSTRFENDSNVGQSSVVDSFTLDFEQVNSTSEKGTGKIVDAVDFVEPNGGGEEK